MREAPKPSPSLSDEFYERRLSPEEFAAALRASECDDEENARIAEQIEWFQKRYPTVAQRLAYVRNRTAAWRRAPKL